MIETLEAVPLASSPTGVDDEKREAILIEIEKILTSSYFRNAARCKQFLKYVVQHQLDGRSDLLKERTIGTDVFLRPPGYATGDDPVVRVQAGEVRRRLEQYYQTALEDSGIRIELPVGSYTPVFHNASLSAPVESPLPAAPIPAAEIRENRRNWVRWGVVGLSAALAIGATAGSLALYRSLHQKSVLEKFWNPVLSTQQPVMICLAKGISYRPSVEMYEKYSRIHPGTFQSEVERSSEQLPLDADEKLTWNDMQLQGDYGVATGDVSAAVDFSALLGRMGKPNQVRIGANYSFQDLRNSPAVVVGAFNNKWSMHMLSSLHFAFIEEDGRYLIREQIPGGKEWLTIGRSDAPEKDYAIVSRLLDSKTGQFTIVAAGITGNGTQSAGEFATNPVYLEEGLRNAPPNWQAKNMEVLLETTVTDSIAGPPHVIGTYFW